MVRLQATVRTARGLKMIARTVPLATLFSDYGEARETGASRVTSVVVVIAEVPNVMPVSVIGMSTAVADFLEDVRGAIENTRDFSHGVEGMGDQINAATSFQN